MKFLSNQFNLTFIHSRPVVSEGQYIKIWGYINEAKDAGYNFLYGGNMESVSRESGNVSRQKTTNPLEGHNGFFIPPTVIVDVPITSRVWREEIFGPVLCVRVSLVQ